MKYVYYDSGTRQIKIISPVKETSAEYPYVEIEDADIEDIFFGRANIIDARVVVNSKTSTVGKIEMVKKVQRDWRSINDWIYLIPKEHGYEDEFVVKQDLTNKTITLTLTPTVKEWWKENNFFQRKEFIIAACADKDPHLMLWYKVVDSEALLNNIEFEYTGEDDLYFFTHRFFENYRHEQHT